VRPGMVEFLNLDSFSISAVENGDVDMPISVEAQPDPSLTTMVCVVLGMPGGSGLHLAAFSCRRQSNQWLRTA
jgi:hypothetical protein